MVYICLRMKKVLSVRVENKLYTTVNKHSLPNSKLVCEALESYLNGGANGDVNDTYTTHLEGEIQYLRAQNNALMMAKIPILSRIKLKLLETKQS